MTERFNWTGLSDKLAVTELIRQLNVRMPRVSRALRYWPTIFDVRRYGVTGNGITDETEGLVAGHKDAQAAKGVLYLPAGVYRYSDKIFDITDRMAIMGDGKRQTFLKPLSSYTDYAITVTDCWRNGVERADDTDLDPNDTKAGVYLTGFSICGDRATAARGIATIGIVDFLTLTHVGFTTLNGTALQLGIQDGASSLGVVRESYFEDVLFETSGNASEPAFDVGGGALAVAGDGTNDLTLVHMNFANNKGVHWRIQQTNSAESIRGIHGYGIVLNGDATEATAPTAADLLQITGNVGDVQLNGLFITGSTVVGGVHYAGVRVAANAAGTPDRITLQGDVTAIVGDGYVVEGVTGMTITGTSGVTAGAENSLELKVAASAIGSYLEYNVHSNQAVNGRLALMSIATEADANKISGTFRTGKIRVPDDGDTTPDVSNVDCLITVNTSACAITDFDMGGAGQQIIVTTSDAVTTLTHDASKLFLRGSVSRLLTTGETVHLIHTSSTLWREVV